MSVLSISLPDDVREWVEQEAAASGASISEVLGRVAREAKERTQNQRAAKEAELERLLLEGLDSGEGEWITPEWWQNFRAELQDELEKQRQNGKSHA